LLVGFGIALVRFEEGGVKEEKKGPKEARGVVAIGLGSRREARQCNASKDGNY
jgi:hypothetical protein